ncbi:alpha-ketoglutarate dehydrogenase component 4 isoform X2 [Centroberyx gerrardi]
MGSKVSSKMAAPTARIIQAVRPHAPLIKFPNRHGIPKPNELSRFPLGCSVSSTIKTCGTCDPTSRHTRHPGLDPSAPSEIPQETAGSGGDRLHPAWWTRVTHSDSMNTTKVLICGNQYVSLLNPVPQHKRTYCHTTSGII